MSRRIRNIGDVMSTDEELQMVEESEEQRNACQIPHFSEILECCQEYSTAHQFLATILVSKGIITKKKFYLSFIEYVVSVNLKRHRNVVAKIACSQEELDNLVSLLCDQMNPPLSELGFRVRLVTEEETGREMVALITEDVLPKELCSISGFSLDEFALFARYIQQMMENGGECELSWALQEGSKLPNPMSLMKTQVFIDRLIRAGWILEKDEYIRLSSRAIAELEPVLTTKYGCPVCALCQKVVVSKSAAVTCNFCNVYIHRHCWTKLAEGCEADEISCPGGAITGCSGMFSKTDVSEQFS